MYQCVHIVMKAENSGISSTQKSNYIQRHKRTIVGRQSQLKPARRETELEILFDRLLYTDNGV